MRKTLTIGLLLAVALVGGEALAQQAPTAPSIPEITSENATGEAARVIALDKKVGEAIVAGDVAFFQSITAVDFTMTHGSLWTSGGEPTRVDGRKEFLEFVKSKSYKVYELSHVKVEMHHNVAIVYGRYIANFPASSTRPADHAWFSCWFQHVYERQNGAWMYVSHRTISGPVYGETHAAIQDK